MEKALRKSEEKFRAFIENILDFVYQADMEGSFIMVNPAGARMLGYDSMEEMIGLPVREVYANPDDRKLFLDALSRNGSVSGNPINLKSRSGTILHVIANRVPVGVEGVLHDLTDLHRAEEGLRAAIHKLNLLSSITRHDIMNQLQALFGYIQFSAESLGQPDILAGYLAKEKIIAMNIQRQTEFTRDYEDIGVKSPAWQGISKLIHEVSSVLLMQEIRLVVECKGIEIFADPLLYKVFYNLIDNALRYGGGKMTSIRLHAYPEKEHLILIFEDDGKGISTDDKPKLFTRGFGKNTGLGLFLSREILAITGITIIENGKPGDGARFEMTVPNDKWRAAP
jgi:PAS domain S-box-containing protein